MKELIKTKQTQEFQKKKLCLKIQKNGLTNILMKLKQLILSYIPKKVHILIDRVQMTEVMLFKFGQVL